MKKKIVFFITIACLFAAKTSAQDFTVKLGIVQEIPKKTYLDTVFGYHNGSVYGIRLGNSPLERNRPFPTYVLEKYSGKSFKLAARNKLEYEKDFKNKLSFDDFRVTQSGPVILANQSNTETTTYAAHAYKVNTKGAMEKEPIELTTHTGELAVKASQHLVRFSPKRKFRFETSADGSKVLLWSDKPEKRSDNEEFVFKVVDHNLADVWARPVVLPVEADLFDFKKVRIDSAANVYILGRVYQDRDIDRRDGVANFHYVMLVYNADGSEEKYDVNIGDFFIKDADFNIEQSGTIICAGLYSEKNTNRVKGVFYLDIDQASGKVAAKNTQEFSESLRQEFMGDKKAKKGEKELYEYLVKGILPTPGGGITLLAEQYFETEIVRETYTVDKYHFNDVIAFGINGEGETTWSVRVPKKQVGVGTPLNQSFIHGRVGEKVYLIFNDHPKNVGVKDLDNPALLLADKDAVITVVAIDDSGKHTREPLFSTREEGTIISPSLFQKISEKEWLVHLEQKKSFRFATILFD